jgi:hypothetical protein
VAQRNPPSAAQALYPHLKAGTPEPVQQRRKPNSLAEAMWPRPQRPKGLNEEDPWYDIIMAAGGLRRIR